MFPLLQIGRQMNSPQDFELLMTTLLLLTTTIEDEH